jgi:hypothetical protein
LPIKNNQFAADTESENILYSVGVSVSLGEAVNSK